MTFGTRTSWTIYKKRALLRAYIYFIYCVDYDHVIEDCQRNTKRSVRLWHIISSQQTNNVHLPKGCGCVYIHPPNNQMNFPLNYVCNCIMEKSIDHISVPIQCFWLRKNIALSFTILQAYRKGWRSLSWTVSAC